MSISNLPTLSDAVSLGRFLTKVPRLLRRQITSEEAHGTLRHELRHREPNFLSLVRTAIYNHPTSPYRKLLDAAGCTYADLERLVSREGLEAALNDLCREGVYLTLDEFKGRRPVVRGRVNFEIAPGDLRNPHVRADMIGRTGASRGPGTILPVDFAVQRTYALDAFLELEARRAMDWSHAIWLMPGSTALIRLLRFTWCGAPLIQWFSLVDPTSAGLHARYLWSARVMRWAGRIGGVRLPSPTFVDLNDPLPIVQWMASVLRAGGTPHLQTYGSCAVRVCQTARMHGIDLDGARFTIGGEPATATRISAIQQAGGRAVIRYAASEVGVIGMGCAAAEAPDEVHFLHERCAVGQPGDLAGPALPVDALLLTTILPRARLVLLNVSMGDRAVVTQRRCGCPMEALGWTTHMHSIRSFEKLTAAGVTFLDADLIHVLEEVLPQRFGGGPTDYQLLDEESPDGKPRVRLFVHPRLGPMDPEQVRQTFLDAIGTGSGVERVMMLVWRDAGLPIVEREAPRVTSGGKILHVHLDRPNRLSVNNAD